MGAESLVLGTGFLCFPTIYIFLGNGPSNVCSAALDMKFNLRISGRKKQGLFCHEKSGVGGEHGFFLFSARALTPQTG